MYNLFIFEQALQFLQQSTVIKNCVSKKSSFLIFCVLYIKVSQNCIEKYFIKVIFIYLKLFKNYS